jgi:hypothetical protein
MNTKPNLRKMNLGHMLYATLLLIILLSLGFAVPALTQGIEDNNVFTGCVNRNSGVIRNIAVGYEPVKACNEEEYKITWDHARPEFDSRIAALEQRVAELEEPFGTLELFVDCNAADTVGAALDEAQTHFGPVNITISGVCEENVVIERDDINISGLERNDGIHAADTAGWTVLIDGARNVGFSNMTISSGDTGIITRGGSYFGIENVTVRDATNNGISVSPGASAFIVSSSILDNAESGIEAHAGGTILVRNSEISGSFHGLFASQGGTIMGLDLHVIGNETGVGGHMGGEISIWRSTIEQNNRGVVGELNSSIKVGSSTTIANNEWVGVEMGSGSVFVASDNSIIEGNGGPGILAEGGSNISLGFPNASIIRDNGGDGILLRDLSIGDVGDDSQIINNGGWGINCAGPQAITSVQLPYGTAADLSGNILGSTNCP